MKSINFLICVNLTVWIVASSATAQDVTQTITLQPGWNAIYLEVQPEPAAPADPACLEPLDPACVFLGVNVASVWRYVPTIGTAAFVSTPGADDLNDSSNWLGWFPAPGEKSMLSTLDEIRVNRAYLVNLEGAQPATLVLTGRPSLERIDWAPDGFTLTGFPVVTDPVSQNDPSPPTFAEFFLASDAHADAVNDGLIYELSGSGVWEAIDAGSTTIRSGSAYWVFTRGGSQHQGPIEVTPSAGDGLDFGSVLVNQSIRVRLRSGLPVIDFNLAPGAGASQVPLAYRTIASVEFDNATSACLLTWRAFPGSISLPSSPCEAGEPEPVLVPGQQVALHLGIVRRDFQPADTDTASILTISNGTGVRLLVPVSGSRGAP